jgi:hypothetical protein
MEVRWEEWEIQLTCVLIHLAFGLCTVVYVPVGGLVRLFIACLALRWLKDHQVDGYLCA